jgi:hypothetical protein
MSQKQYVAKPEKVIAEQYIEGTVPDAAGVHRCGLSPVVATGPPHVHANGQVYFLNSTDWILTDKWTNEPTGVLTDEQFQDTFGAGPPTITGEA